MTNRERAEELFKHIDSTGKESKYPFLSGRASTSVIEAALNEAEKRGMLRAAEMLRHHCPGAYYAIKVEVDGIEKVIEESEANGVETEDEFQERNNGLDWKGDH